MHSICASFIRRDTPPRTTFPLAHYLWDSKLNILITVYLSSDHSMLSAKAQGPIDNFGLLSLQLCIWIINLEFQVSHYLISRVFHK